MKRLFDIIASGCGLLVLSPVLLVGAKGTGQWHQHQLKLRVGMPEGQVSGNWQPCVTILHPLLATICVMGTKANDWLWKTI